MFNIESLNQMII
jgi:hypothetical protein